MRSSSRRSLCRAGWSFAMIGRCRWGERGRPSRPSYCIAWILRFPGGLEVTISAAVQRCNSLMQFPLLPPFADPRLSSQLVYDYHGRMSTVRVAGILARLGIHASMRSARCSRRRWAVRRTSRRCAAMLSPAAAASPASMASTTARCCPRRVRRCDGSGRLR